MTDSHDRKQKAGGQVYTPCFIKRLYFMNIVDFHTYKSVNGDVTKISFSIITQQAHDVEMTLY